MRFFVEADSNKDFYNVRSDEEAWIGEATRYRYSAGTVAAGGFFVRAGLA